MGYVVVIPSFKRAAILVRKTLKALKDGQVNPKLIHVFVANQQQHKEYLTVLPRDMYHMLIIGVVGIMRQRRFITQYFPVGQNIVSMDDDISRMLTLKREAGGLSKQHLVPLVDLDAFFKQCFVDLKATHLYLAGVYPVHNAFFMQPQPRVTTTLKFIQGAFFAYINRHDRDLQITQKEKEDYQFSVLNYIKDGGVLRYNHIAAQTRMEDLPSRRAGHKAAAEYMVKKYPELARFKIRNNGKYEINLRDTSK